MRKLLFIAAFITLTTTFSRAIATPKIHICGDSMSSIYGDQSNALDANEAYNQGMRGWAQFFGDYTTLDVQDWAHTGTTAKGFYSGANYWKAAIGITDFGSDGYKTYLEERPYVKDFSPITSGDFVILVWGHNDQKGSSGYKTVTESEYVTYLTKMVQEVRAKGAYPVLGTSICRCLFKNRSLTYLGKIDACEAVGAIHPTDGSDCPYDYPQAVRTLAKTLNVPCLDLNAGSRTLWEDFGQSLSASIFFPNGGTTHTSEAGARSMAIYANNTIKSWASSDLNGSSLSDYQALIDAMKADVKQYDKADYSAQEAKVSAETIWTFDLKDDGTPYASCDILTDSVRNYNGLYLRGMNTSSGHNITAKSLTSAIKTVTLSDGTSYTLTSPYLAASVSGQTGASLSAESTAGMVATSSSDRMIALNTAGPGTLYVAMAHNSATDGRYFSILFNGADSVRTAMTDIPVKAVKEFKIHTDKAGTFFIFSGVSTYYYLIKYVPDADSSEDDMHEPAAIRDIQHPSPITQHPVFNLSGQQTSNNVHGLYISNGKKFINK